MGHFPCDGNCWITSDTSLARRPLFLGQGEAVDGFAFEGFVRVQVLTGSVEVAMAHQALHRDDVAAALKQARGVGVAVLCSG